jgi:hypothetical protein
MNELRIALTECSTISLRSPITYHFHKFRITLFALVALAVLSFAGSAIAQQRFSLLGVWQQTAQTGVQTLTFNPDETFNCQMAVPPGPNGQGSGLLKWWGRYRATGAASYTYQVQTFQLCPSGVGCSHCPPQRGDFPGNDVCQLARSMGLEVGVQNQVSVQMQGPNQYADQSGQTWRRVR